VKPEFVVGFRHQCSLQHFELSEARIDFCLINTALGFGERDVVLEMPRL